VPQDEVIPQFIYEAWAEDIGPMLLYHQWQRALFTSPANPDRRAAIHRLNGLEISFL
jgi:hypothetical protein